MKTFLPGLIISASFYAFWLAKYPRQIWEAQTFQLGPTTKDKVISVITWVFFLNFCFIVSWLVSKFIPV